MASHLADFEKNLASKEFSIVSAGLHQKIYGKCVILEHELVSDNPPINYVIKIFDGTKEPDNLMLTVQMKTENQKQAKKAASFIYLEHLYPEVLRGAGFSPESVQSKETGNLFSQIE